MSVNLKGRLTNFVDRFMHGAKTPEAIHQKVGMLGDCIASREDQGMVTPYCEADFEHFSEAAHWLFAKNVRVQEIPYPTKEDMTWGMSHTENPYWKPEFLIPKAVFDHTTQPRAELKDEPHWRYHPSPYAMLTDVLYSWYTVKREAVWKGPAADAATATES